MPTPILVTTHPSAFDVDHSTAQANVAVIEYQVQQA
jgi:hypothetical protein